MPRDVFPAILVLLLLVVGCGDKDGVRVGIKPFTEQEILAEVLDRVLTDAEIATRPPYRCRDTYDCQRALESGYVDVMVEYTGTALHLVGAPPADQAVPEVQWLDSLYGPMGIRWTTPLGFDNGYVWLMPTATATAAGMQTLSDLAERDEPLRVATPPEYVRRPRDGLPATAERYGIALAPEPLIEADPLARYQAVLQGRADVAVGYATDGNLQALGFTVLADDLSFFRRYQAALMVRDDALEREVGLAEALSSIENQIDGETMQRLNRAALGGEPAESVALRFLREHDLLGEAPAPVRRVPLKVAVGSEAIERAFGTQALAAVRTVFDDRTVVLEQTDAPVRAVARGEARLAVAGAEAFFDQDRRGRIRRRQDVEAVAVLGRNVVHVLAPAGSDRTALSGKVGVSAGGFADRLLALAGTEATGRGSTQEMVAAVQAGELDAALVIAPQGDTVIAEALEAGLSLIDLSGWLEAERPFAMPFLRPMRLRPGTYPNQDAAIDTLASQVLLVAATPRTGPSLAGGPAAAIPAGARPLQAQQREALADAVGNPEAPDPAVPSAYALSRSTPTETPSQRWVDGALNAFVIAFLAWLAFIVLDPRDQKPDPDEA